MYKCQEQQGIAVGPGNEHFISICQLSSNAACVGTVVWPAAAAALLRTDHLVKYLPLKDVAPLLK